MLDDNTCNDAPPQKPSNKKRKRLERSPSAEGNVTEETIGSQDTDEDDEESKITHKKHHYVHVEREFRNSMEVKLLRRQRFGIMLHYCDECRIRNTNNSITVQVYQQDYLVLVLLCKACLENNMVLGNTHFGHFPEIENSMEQTENKHEIKGYAFNSYFIIICICNNF